MELSGNCFHHIFGVGDNEDYKDQVTLKLLPRPFVELSGCVPTSIIAALHVMR